MSYCLFQVKTKCDNCISAENIAAQQPQIFVVAAAPQEAQNSTQTVKYETQETQVTSQTPQASLGTQNSIPIGVKAVTGTHDQSEHSTFDNTHTLVQ